MVRLVVPSVLLATALLSSGAAFAATRTYVASYGNDANAASNCAPTAPCRTFAAAMPVTDSGGEIVVLDSAGYGSLTIDKSIAIIAPDGVYAGLTAASGNVVTIATAGVTVTLKGLAIRGPGTGTYGIHMTNGAKLHLENCEISAHSTGIYVQTAAKVRVADSTIRDNTYGIWAGSGVTLHVLRAHVVGNSAAGIELAGGSTGTATASISDTVVTGSVYCVWNLVNSGTTGIIGATRTTVTGCGDGFKNEVTGTGIMTVSDSMVIRNTTGFNNASGTFKSLGNNHVEDNGTDTTGTITLATPK